MTKQAPEMFEVSFDVSGNSLPDTYPFDLWHALLRHIPALESSEYVGVLPLRTAASEAGWLLPKRAKLVLRLPDSLVDHTESLSDQILELGSSILKLGKRKLRPIQPYPTLHAHLVSAAEDEVEFINNVLARLAELEIPGKLICGMRNSLIAPNREIHGFSLVIHDLKPDASLRLQYTGLGADRQFGCGIFVPYKVITDLD
ncbi:MAG: type I-MYXAN CRISPR-associated protein Cas6/Cmx6 [Gallionellaceae bacterium]|jgi:CRISPR-associated protein Cas6